MILRRMTEAIRAQDWLTVLIEIAIVVIGVFLGIQVSNWNEARLEHDREQAALARLLREAENAVAYLDRFIEDQETLNRERERAVAFLFDAAGTSTPGTETADALQSLSHYPAMTPVRAVYDELTASGGFASLTSTAVRDAVSLYIAELETHDSRLGYFRQSDGATFYREFVPFTDNRYAG